MFKTWKKVKAILYLLLSALCIGYFLVCVLYAGLALSWIWIWPLFAAFCFVRFWMLSRQIKGKTRIKIPLLFRILYSMCFVTGLVVFIYVESLVIGGMNTVPEQDLPYMIVLGAGIRGSAPTRPLLLRMQAAAEYLEDNPETIVIASGGQGPNEDLSEAQCIYEYLVEKGVDPDRILLEDQSKSTEENIRNSFAMIPKDTEKVGILSNGFHIYRATRIAEKQGHDNVCGIPSRTLLPVGIHYTVREFFAIIKLEIFG